MLPVPTTPSASPSSPGSTRGVSDFQLPSLYQFSALDAASAVDYSKDIEVNDGVVDSPPAKVASLKYAPSPSPLCKEKRALERRRDASPPGNDGDARQGPSRRLRLEPLTCDGLAESVPPSTILSPLDVLACVDVLPEGGPRKSTPSVICRSESNRCLALRRSGRNSSPMVELAGVVSAPFETMTRVLDKPTDSPATKVRSCLPLFHKFPTMVLVPWDHCV